MAFDWQNFLDRHGIDYRSEKKDLYIHCPFCGSADTGKHMGVSTVGRGWGCWRQQTHRGRSPERLIQALIGCSWAEAAHIAGRGAGAALQGLGGFMATVEGALGATAASGPPRRLVKPKNFKPLRWGPASPFCQYLADRGFTREEINWLGKRYELHYAWTGDWGYRLIIPVHDRAGRWFTWTGRAVNETAKIRYKTLTADSDKAGQGNPVAVGPITDCLLGLPYLFKGGRTLILAEGPFDAMRLSLFTEDYNVRATCFFGKAISDRQVELLMELRPLYQNMVLLLDPDAALDAMALQTKLAPVGVLSHLLPGDDDPGEMSASAIRGLVRALPNVRRQR